MNSALPILIVALFAGFFSFQAAFKVSGFGLLALHFGGEFLPSDGLHVRLWILLLAYLFGLAWGD